MSKGVVWFEVDGQRLADKAEVCALDGVLRSAPRTEAKLTFGCMPSAASTGRRTKTSLNLRGMSAGSTLGLSPVFITDGPCSTLPVTVRRSSGAPACAPSTAAVS